jgi:hypothetical protein
VSRLRRPAFALAPRCARPLATALPGEFLPGRNRPDAAFLRGGRRRAGMPFGAVLSLLTPQR